MDLACRQAVFEDRVKLAADLRNFQHRLGHTFARPDLLARALTHASLSSETRGDNQRLEFLGDRVLNLAIADALFHEFPGADEGVLAPRYNELVRKETCAAIAREIGLGDAMKLGRGEMLKGGRRNISALGDGMEAVIGAVYLDAGFGPARALVLRLWGARVREVQGKSKDAKTGLQEWAQARGMPPPDYAEQARSGPDHAPQFTVRVTLENGEAAEGTASSKRAAEQEAAGALMARLGE
jgi:ribonuclease-3